MKKIIFLLALSISFTQCVYDDYEPLNYDTNASDSNGSDTGSGTDTGTGGGTTTSNKTTYLENVQPILNQLCVSCHGAVNPKDGLNLSTYALAKNKIDKIISSMSKQSGKVMPPSGRVADNLIQTMIDWKTDGLLEGSANSGGGTGTSGGTGTGTSGGTGTGGGTTTSNKTTYLGNVQPILNQLCVSCHGAVNPKDDLDISTYALAKKKIDKIISSMSKQGDKVMPPTGRVADNLIQTMIDWKTDGLLEGDANSSGGTGTGTSGGTTTNITYTANIQPILAQQCTSCHGSSNASANLNLTDYATTKAKIDIVISRIDLQNGQAGIMPTSGRMSTANIQAFKDWKTQGFIQ